MFLKVESEISIMGKWHGGSDIIKRRREEAYRLSSIKQGVENLCSSYRAQASDYNPSQPSQSGEPAARIEFYDTNKLKDLIEGKIKASGRIFVTGGTIFEALNGYKFFNNSTQKTETKVPLVRNAEELKKYFDGLKESGTEVRITGEVISTSREEIEKQISLRLGISGGASDAGVAHSAASHSHDRIILLQMLSDKNWSEARFSTNDGGYKPGTYSLSNNRKLEIVVK